MKKFAAFARLIAAFSLVPFAVKSQNWALFPLNQRSVWEAGDEAKLHFCDSSEVLPDGSVRHFFGLQYLGAEAGASCFDSVLFAVKGLTSLPIDTFYSKNGAWRIPFSGGQTLDFFTQKGAGEGWGQPFSAADFDSISIFCLLETLGDAVDEEDSIKTFQVKTFKNGQPAASSLDGQTVVLSQHFGLLAYPNFKNWAAAAVEKRTLVGFENGALKKGFTHRWIDYFGGFEKRQVLKYAERFWTGQYVDRLRRDSITGVSIAANGVELQVFRQSRSIFSTLVGTPPNASYKYDTTFFNGPATAFFSPPSPPFFLPFGPPDWFSIRSQMDYGPIRKGPFGGWSFTYNNLFLDVTLNDQNECLKGVFDPCIGPYAFNSPIGQTFIDVLCLGGPQYFELIGFRSDSLAWGNFDKISVAREAVEWAFSIAPNPTDGPLFVSMPSGFSGQKIEATIFSVAGKPLRSQLLEAGETLEINAAGLPAGPLFLRLRGEKGATGGRLFWKN